MQFISDNQGNKTAVVISISNWNKLIKKYTDLENDVMKNDIPEWHKEIIDSRLKEYLENPKDVLDFEIFCNELEKEL